MDEIKKAMLGDKEAQRAVTEREELLPCYRCGGTRISLKHNGWYYYECCDCGARSQESCFGTAYIQRLWNTRPQLLTAEEMERLEGLK